MPPHAVCWPSFEDLCCCYFLLHTAPRAMLANNQACGDTQQPCRDGYRCFDGFNCCPDNTPVCGGKCCGGDWSCVSGVCVAPGTTPCGRWVCEKGWECLEDNLCCRPSDTVCNHKCCSRGNVCRDGMCVAPDAEPCGVSADGNTTLHMCHLPEQFCADAARGKLRRLSY